MPRIELEVRNPSGLHARPAALFVETARRFSADVQVANLTRNPEQPASARSTAASGDWGSNDLLMSDVLRRHELQVWFLAEHLVELPLVDA